MVLPRPAATLTKPMRGVAVALLCGGLWLAGCAGGDPFSRHVSQCTGAGHAPGSPGFSQCMSQTSAAAMEPSDERRERQRWEARLERERVAAEQRVRDEARSVIGMNR